MRRNYEVVREFFLISRRVGGIRAAAVNEEKNRILSAPDGEGSIPYQSERFARKDYVYTIGNYLYKCHCEYGQDGNLISCASERMGLKEDVLQTYDSILASLDARYQEILGAVEE